MIRRKAENTPGEVEVNIEVEVEGCYSPRSSNKFPPIPIMQQSDQEINASILFIRVVL
jgi:hypothetical protein